MTSSQADIEMRQETSAIGAKTRTARGPVLFIRHRFKDDHDSGSCFGLVLPYLSAATANALSVATRALCT